MPVTLEEVRKVLGSLAKEKIPGPNGWTVEFFQHFFEFMGEDILRAVEESRSKAIFPKKLNETFIALIPKLDRPEGFTDYWPISLCNALYKLVSKIIACRIKPFLAKFISMEQFRFLFN